MTLLTFIGPANDAAYNRDDIGWINIQANCWIWTLSIKFISSNIICSIRERSGLTSRRGREDWLHRRWLVIGPRIMFCSVAEGYVCSICVWCTICPRRTVWVDRWWDWWDDGQTDDALENQQNYSIFPTSSIWYNSAKYTAAAHLAFNWGKYWKALLIIPEPSIF